MSWKETTMVARRLQARHTEITVKMDFAPTDYQHMAGLVVMYDSYNFFYLHMTADDSSHRELRIIYRDNKDFFDPLNGGMLDCSNLADEHYAAMGHEGHTGTFVGMACQDLSGCVEGEVCFADFAYMTYTEVSHEP